MGNFTRRAAPAVVLTGTAVALVAMFDQGMHATAGTEGAAALPASAKATAGDGTATPPKSSSTPSQAPSDSATPTPSSDPTTQSSSDCSTAQEYMGDVANTRWGPVQVVITAAGGTICSADAVQYPDGDNRSAQISQYSIPLLNEQAVSQNGDISGVSGASYTAYGYYQSLQSALQQAK